MVNSNKSLRQCFALLLVLLSLQSFAQLSKKHYIPPLSSAEFGNAIPEDQYIYLSTPNNGNVPFTVIPVGAPEANYITGTVSNGAPVEISVGNGYGQLFIQSSETSTIQSNRGYIIEAEAPIYVSVRMNAGGGAQAGALVSKGLSALGNIFRIGTFTNANPQDNYANFLSVMATEDDTEVSFSNLDTGLVIKNYTGALPITRTLNEGESYTIVLNSADALVNRTGLIGSLVSSDKPIVVNCGSANGSFGSGGGRDYGIDQIVGLDKVGNEYIFVRGDGPDEWENVLIVAHSDNTAISVNGTPGFATINAGDFVVIEGDQYNADGNMYVETSADVFAYQGTGANNEANQGMFFVPPLSCETRGNINNIANIDRIGNTNYSGGLSIVTKAGATVTINNQALTNFATIGPSNVDGNTNYVTYKITGLNGNISVEGNDELYVAYFNVNGFATSGSFYSGFPSAPEINFNLQFSALGNCIPNVTLEAANAQNFDSFDWLFDDGTGFVSLNLNTPTLTPNQPGRYKLVGIITCTGELLESVEVPVSICPDDRDNDGIIDNIDIDNDNDGIENCDESNGNVTANLTDALNPVLEFQDSSTNNSIVSVTYTQSNANGNPNGITGGNQGEFNSVVGATVSGENNYTMSFTETLNFRLSENTAIPPSITADEVFIARVFPANKNITLVDPDDRLLVDTNFDGIFETGVTQISGSEIQFQINPAATGNTPFNFYASEVDGFAFVHTNANLSTASVFNGIISFTCYKKDNDGDGIIDAHDLDSDNDGIPDIIERSGELTTLSGIDANNDGLDDIFTSIAGPIDSDNDGVLDFYDLDSDNDGIYDLIETGQLGTLSDTNLDGIEDGPTYGTNGWADAAETAPDSNQIGYTPNDLDADGIFSYHDLDSDGDECSDVIEAGFSDGNADDLLGNVPVTVDVNGLVNNAIDGYIIPDANYLTIAPIAITTQPQDIEVCESSDNNISLTSTTFDTIQWEVSTDGVNWNNIIDDATYSDSQTASLLITDTPLILNGYFFRAFLNRTGNACGLYSNIMQLTVIELPIANIAPTIQQCDDDNNGTASINLENQNNNISTQTDITITYHASQAEADINDNAITSPFETGNTTIYARVENNGNTSCFATSSFNIEVYNSPFPAVATNIDRIQDCDNNSVGNDTDGVITFDLTEREDQILNGQLASEFTVSYFTDASYSNMIPTPSSFNNTVANLQTIYVRVFNTVFPDCFADTSFEIEVSALPQVSNPDVYQQCDDDSNDGQALFNLTLDSIKEEINPNYLSEGLVFTYYETQAEAETTTNPITDPNAYQDALGFATETIWIRVENTNTCFRVVPLDLQVSPSSAALASYVPMQKYQCDDGTDLRDGVATFDLSDIQNEIENTVFNSINVSVHFYESLIDAELETNEILDITNHENTNSPNVQTIWVRVKSDLGNDCLGLEGFQDLLNVEALPIANPVTIPRQCDFDLTDAVLSYPFDVSQLETDILNAQNPLDVTITYFDSTGNPLLYNDGSFVTSPIQPIFLSETQDITVRVTNNATQDPDGPCFEETIISFIVDEQPVANPIAAQIFCDGDNGDIDDDGILPFDTSAFTATILGTQMGMDVFYTYVDDGGNTVSNSPSLPNPFNSANQTISVEVINPINQTCTATTTIDLIVNPLPEFSVESPQIVCTSDPTFQIELEPFENNPSELFDYEWNYTNVDGTITNQFLSSNRLITVSEPGIYTITLTKTDGTGCPRSRDIIVDASEQATIIPEDVTIVDINTSEYNSVTIDPTGLGNGNYDYALSPRDSSIIDYQSDPFFENVIPGFYTIYVRDPICGVSTLDISVIGYLRYFTPNGDSFNDFWSVRGIDASTQPRSVVRIYDRYGKLIKQLSTSSDGWDGTYNGQLMPTDDYWFKVNLEDGRSFMGHFTLKR